MKIVTHKRLQQYEHHYGMVCLTGFLGCRWHRYQQSTERATKIITYIKLCVQCDLAWFAALVFVTAYLSFWFYFWLLTDNNFDEFNWHLYQLLDAWMPYYTIFLILTCITLGYVLLLLLLVFCHVGHGHQLYVHPLHRGLLLLTAICCGLVTILVQALWRSSWALQGLALSITSPFLHVGAVVLMTLLTWVIAAQWVQLYNKGAKALWMCLYLMVMISLYVCPLFIKSPCITDSGLLPPPPQVLAHRGASAMSPENTNISFQLAADIFKTYAFHTEVSISLDGIPFLLRDPTLRRVTNVEKVFPQEVRQEACFFNMSDIEQLDAGSWFLQTNPFRTARFVDSSEKSKYPGQGVVRLSRLLSLAEQYKTHVLLDLPLLMDSSLCRNHPHREAYMDIIVRTIQESGISPEMIWWQYSSQSNSSSSLQFERVAPLSSMNSLPALSNTSTRLAYIDAAALDFDGVKLLQSEGVDLVVGGVNSAWLYSLCWCLGVNYTSSQYIHQLHDLQQPVWTMTPQELQVMWVTTDVASAIIIILIFIIFKLRHTGKEFSSEKLSLQGARIRMSQLHHNRNMKEKLLHTVESLQEMEPGILGMSSSPTTPVPGDSHPSFANASLDGSRDGNASNRLSDLSSHSGMSDGSGVRTISGGFSALSGPGQGSCTWTNSSDSPHHSDGKLADVSHEHQVKV